MTLTAVSGVDMRNVLSHNVDICPECLRSRGTFNVNAALLRRCAVQDDDGYTERRLAMDEAMVARLQIVRIIISPSAS